MSDSKESKAYEYKESAGFEPKYKFVKVTPTVGRDETIGSGQSHDYNIDTLDCGINYARSYVQYDRSITWGMTCASGAGTTCIGIYENIKAPPYFHGVVFQPDKTTTAVINITNNLQDINQQIKPYTMTYDEYKNRDSLDSCCFPCKDISYNALITSGNAGDGTNSTTINEDAMDVTNIDDIQCYKSNMYVALTATTPMATDSVAISETGIKVSLKDLVPRSLFGIDKVIPSSAKGVGQITFTMGFPERSLHTRTVSGTASAFSPQGTSGTLSAYAGQLSIKNFSVYFCVETNKDVELALKNQVLSSNGWSIHIPYCVFNQNTLTSRTNHTVNYTIEPGYGSYLREVYLSPQNVSQTIGSYI